MVDYLLGIVKELRNQEIVVDIGTVGLSLQVPNSNLFEKDVSIKIYSYMHWNAEQGPTLFGFAQPLERSVFRLIINCSGIGPKIALAILADLGAQSFLQAIASNDEVLLSKVNGIGKKKAEHIIVQLKHKVSALIESGVDIGDMKNMSQLHDVSQALQSLHYSKPEITQAMDHLKKNIQLSDVSFDYLLRSALSFLSK